MRELPDITAYIAALEPRILGATLERVRLHSVFVLRTADPPIESVNGLTVREIRRIGKRIAIGFEGGGGSDGDPNRDLAPHGTKTVRGDPGLLWLVIHLMIAG